MEKKEKIISLLQTIALIVWGISIVAGATIGGSDGSAGGGAFMGFLLGLGIVILIAFLVRVIDDPSRLLYLLICPPIGILIGLIWGNDGAMIGAAIGGVVAFLFIADMIKKE